MLIVLHSSNNIDFANYRPEMNTELNSKIIKEIFEIAKKEIEESINNGIDLKKLVNGKDIMNGSRLDT